MNISMALLRSGRAYDKFVSPGEITLSHGMGAYVVAFEGEAKHHTTDFWDAVSEFNRSVMREDEWHPMKETQEEHT